MWFTDTSWRPFAHSSRAARAWLARELLRHKTSHVQVLPDPPTLSVEFAMVGRATARYWLQRRRSRDPSCSRYADSESLRHRPWIVLPPPNRIWIDSLESLVSMRQGLPPVTADSQYSQRRDLTATSRNPGTDKAGCVTEHSPVNTARSLVVLG